MDDADELRRQVRTTIEALRPHPHRGDLIAAGVAPLTLGVLLLNVRLDAAWGTGIFFVLTGLACFLVLGMGVLAPMEGERPRAYQQVLLLGGLVLLFVTLFRLDQIFGVGAPLGGSGSTFWIFFLLTAAAAWCARERGSAICALAAALSGGVTLLAFVAWVFHADGATTVRWILFLFALGLLLGALVLREGRRKESVYLVDAAGVAMLGVGATYLGSLLVFNFADVGRSVGPGAGWTLILLAAGLGLIAYAGVDEEPGPAYLGALNLALFLVIDGLPGRGGGSVWFWPIVLLLAGGAMIATGLRPRVELPPEPGAEREGETVVPGPFPGPGPGRAGAGALAPEAAGQPGAPGTPGPSPTTAAPPFAPPASPGPSRSRPASSPASSGPPPLSASPPASSGPPTEPVPPAGDGASGDPATAEHDQRRRSARAGDGPAASPDAKGDRSTQAAPDPAPPRSLWRDREPQRPEPPGPGSLWARADVSEDPTEIHERPTEVRPPRPPESPEPEPDRPGPDSGDARD